MATDIRKVVQFVAMDDSSHPSLKAAETRNAEILSRKALDEAFGQYRGPETVNDFVDDANGQSVERRLIPVDRLPEFLATHRAAIEAAYATGAKKRGASKPRKPRDAG